jgi:DNA-binding transcriptional ArsR family regulator
MSSSRDGAEDENAIPRDDFFEILSNRRRRQVIQLLEQRPDGRAELSELVDRIAAWENGTAVDQLSYDDRKSVHISLYQHHAPKMDEAGVIDYDERAGVLSLTEEAGNLTGYLDPPTGPGLCWELYFPAVSVVGGLLVAVGWLTPVSELAVATTVVVAVLLSSLAFLYDRRYRNVGGTPSSEAVSGDEEE